MELTPKIASEITRLYVKEGDIVKKGQVIAELNNSSMSGRLNTTQAKIETVKYNLKYLSDQTEKYRLLYESGAISKDTYEKAMHEKGMLEMQMKELYAAKDELSISMKDTVLKSSISGRVRKVNYNLGDLAMVGKPIAVLDDNSEIVVNVSVTESDLKKIKKDTRILLGFPGTEGKVEASITEIMPSVNPKTRIGEIKIGSIKKDDKSNLSIGSSVEVEFIINEIKDALVVPAKAVKHLAGRDVVYAVKDSIVLEGEIKTGAIIGDKIQVIEGLMPGSNLAVKNINRLYDGARIYVFKGEERN